MNFTGFKKAFIPLVAMGMVVFADVSYAAFGSSRSSSGVSRSYSRPASSSSYSRPVSKPSSSYTPSSSSSSSSGSFWSSKPSTSSSSNTGYRTSNQNYQQNYQQQAPRQNSAMRDIGVTAAGVAGGVLAATAITALVSSPSHSGMFTHPQYPGQYFNQQGQPVAAPRAAAEPQLMMPEQYPQTVNQQQYAPQQQPQSYVVVQHKQESGSFMGALWGFLWFILQLVFFLGVVGAIAFGVYKLFLLGRTKEVQAKVRETLNVPATVNMERDDLDSNAMQIFYDFQKNSNDKVWVAANTKYLPVDDCLSPPSRVLQYEHRTTDCAMEQGKLRGSVLYKAVLDDGTGEVTVNQYWNFEKDNGTWKLIGFESND